MKLKKKIMLVVSMAIMTLSLFLSDMQVKASDVYYLPYAEPSTSDTQGYISLLLRKSDGSLITNTYMWVLSSDSSQQPYMIISIDNDSVGFVPTVGGTTTTKKGYCCLTRYDSVGYFDTVMNFDITSNMAHYEKTFTETIVGYVVKGNCGKINDSMSASNNFQVSFLDDNSSLLLRDILELLTNISNDTDDSTLIAKVTSIVNNTDTIETKLQSLISLLDNEVALMVADLDSISNMINEYFPNFNGDLDSISNKINEYFPLLAADIDSISTKINAYFDLFNGDLDGISRDIKTYYPQFNTTITNIYSELQSLHDDLLNQFSADKNVTDGFKQDSDSQSNELNNLNQQTQVDKIDVDNVSGTVDENLDLDVDSNYGVLLSTFTNNRNVLTMLLAVVSMGLVSYVLFGKR